MAKRVLAVLVAFCVLSSLAFGQAAGQAAKPTEQPVSPFKSFPGMAGLILSATGYGLVIGGGAATSLNLKTSIALIETAPLFSISGAWLSQSYMDKTTKFWTDKGVAFTGRKYLESARTCAIVTTAAGAVSLLAPALVSGTTGTIVSIVFAGVSVCVDIGSFYGPRLNWNKSINEAILASKIDWKAATAP